MNLEQIEYLQELLDAEIKRIEKSQCTLIYNDWRLPTLKELLTLVDYERCNPACKLADAKSYFYQYSTTYANGTDDAWYVHFNIGVDNVVHKASSAYVRCVRVSYDGLEWSASSKETMTWHEAIEYAENLSAPVYYKG